MAYYSITYLTLGLIIMGTVLVTDIPLFQAQAPLYTGLDLHTCARLGPAFRTLEIGNDISHIIKPALWRHSGRKLG